MGHAKCGIEAIFALRAVSHADLAPAPVAAELVVADLRAGLEAEPLGQRSLERWIGKKFYIGNPNVSRDFSGFQRIPKAFN